MRWVVRLIPFIIPRVRFFQRQANLQFDKPCKKVSFLIESRKKIKSKKFKSTDRGRDRTCDPLRIFPVPRCKADVITTRPHDLF